MINTSKMGLISIASIYLALTGCSSDSTGSGSLNLDITDAPIDSAAQVVVSFSGVTIKPENDFAYDIDFVDADGNPDIKTIDLLNLQGSASEPLLINQTLNAGHYNWMRLKVISDKTTTQSYIKLDDGSEHPLYVPSGNETGLKLNQGFDISDGGAISFTIDFDLRKSVIAPSNNTDAYKLKPTLRIIDNENMGHIKGNVGAVSLNDVSCPAQQSNSVYVFTGENITPDDIDGLDAEPVSTALLSDTFNYSVGFLDAGVYTIAFTCQANDDDIEADDVINFIGTSNVTVTAGSTTTFDFD